MNVGDKTQVNGFITQLIWINKKPLFEIEKILGFREGRLKGGADIMILLKRPHFGQFKFYGYNQVPGHRHKPNTELDLKRASENARRIWKSGSQRLVKVKAIQGVDITLSDDANYPPGAGINQWRINEDVLISARVAAMLRDYNDILSI